MCEITRLSVVVLQCSILTSTITICGNYSLCILQYKPLYCKRIYRSLTLSMTPLRTAQNFCATPHTLRKTVAQVHTYKRSVDIKSIDRTQFRCSSDGSKKRTEKIKFRPMRSFLNCTLHKTLLG